MKMSTVMPEPDKRRHATCGVSAAAYCDYFAELFEAIRLTNPPENLNAVLKFAKRATQALGIIYIEGAHEIQILDPGLVIPPSVLSDLRSFAVSQTNLVDLSEEMVSFAPSDGLAQCALSVLPITPQNGRPASIVFVHPKGQCPPGALLKEIGGICQISIERSAEHVDLQVISQSRQIQVDFLKRVLTVGRSDYERTYEDILSACELLIRSRHAVIWLVNQRYGKLTLRAQIGAQEDQLRPVLNVDDSLTGDAIAANDICFIPDLLAPEVKDRFRSHDKATALGLRAMVVIPIRKDRDKKREEIVAVLSIFPSDPEFVFNKEELEIVSTEIGAALRIARDYEREAILDGLLKEAHRSKDLNSYLHRVAQFIAGSMQVEGVSIFVWDEMTQRLQLRGTTGIDSEERKSQIFYLRGEGFTGRVFAEAVPLILDERTQADKRGGTRAKYNETTKEKLGSVLMIPIFRIERADIQTDPNQTVGRRTSIGVIRCANKLTYSKQLVDCFSDADLEMLEYIGRIIAPYIELAQAEDRRASLLSRISHEILSPIASIRGTADHMLRKSTTISLVEAMALTADIQVHATMLRMLCGGIQIVNATAVGLQTYKKREVKLMREVIRPVLDMIKPIARSQHLRFDSIKAFGGEELRVSSDPLALQQIIFNMLTNSVKYMRKEAPDEFWVSIECELGDGCSYVYVSDNGIGIESTEKDHVFDYGYRGKKVHKIDAKGIGLGLFICRTISEGLEAKLDLISLRRPTTFRLRLPLAVKERLR